MGQGKRTAGLWFFRLTLTLRYWPELQADTKPPGPYYENNADSRKRQLGKLSETLSFWNPECSSQQGFSAIHPFHGEDAKLQSGMSDESKGR